VQNEQQSNEIPKEILQVFREFIEDLML
jgi:hypothetical protein